MHSHTEVTSFQIMDFLFVLLFVALIVIYILAVAFTNKKFKKWSLFRIICWCAGISLVAITVIGPIANKAHENFVIHMVSHLLLGMLAPLLLVLSAPVTLLLRTLNTKIARNVTLLLRSGPSKFFTNPIVATFLNVGGLWVLYTTQLFSLMHENNLVYLLVHIHIFLAGYIFTVSMIYIDPVSHRYSYTYRAIVFVIALAGHGILAKYLYANPPLGVLIVEAEQGSKLMYYGGDVIDAVIIFILCLHWYKETRPRTALQTE